MPLPVPKEKDRTALLEQKKQSEEPQIIGKRKKRAERQKKIHTDTGLSLISPRFMWEIRPQGEALCLACLRLPVIIIKAASPTATAEQSSHLERRPVRRKIKIDRTAGQREDDGYIPSNEECKLSCMLWRRFLNPDQRWRNRTEFHSCHRVNLYIFPVLYSWLFTVKLRTFPAVCQLYLNQWWHEIQPSDYFLCAPLVPSAV